MGGSGTVRRRACLRRLCGLLMLPAAAGVRAVRVSDVPLYATLRCAASAKRGAAECVAPAGSHVQLVAEVAGPGVAPSADRHWFARVVAGPCSGAELTVAESCLSDQRSQPEPTPGARPSR